MAKLGRYDAAFFAALDQGALVAADAVVPIVVDALKPTSVVDVGCGSCAWLAVFDRLGVADAVGIDGAWNTVAPNRLPAGRFIRADLLRTVEVGRRFDLAMSIEVAEHLPSDRAEGFIRNLTALSDSVLFSAAIPGQGGEGHVNEAWPSYWASIFASCGYVPLDLVRPQLWERTDVPIAVRQNLLLFVRAESGGLLPSSPHYLDLVHPQWVEALAYEAQHPGLRAIGRELPAALVHALTNLVTDRPSSPAGRTKSDPQS